MIFIWRTATYEKRFLGAIAFKWPIAFVSALLHRLRPSRCIGVVRYCAMMGVQKRAMPRGIPSSADMTGGRQTMQLNEARSRKNHTAYAERGVTTQPFSSQPKSIE